MSNATEHAKGVFLCEVLGSEVGEGVCEIGGRWRALVQTPSLCRDGLRKCNTFAFNSVGGCEDSKECGVFHGSWGVLAGAPVTVPVKISSVVYKSISEYTQAMNNKRH